VERRCSGTATIPSPLFPISWCDCPRVLLGTQTLGKPFFRFLNAPRTDRTNFATGERKGPDANGDRGVYYFYAAEWSFKDIAAFDCECTLSEKSGGKMGWPLPLRLEEGEPIEMRAPRAVADR
jgi:hypothetical protein